MHATTESAEITAQLPSKPRSDIALTALYSAALVYVAAAEGVALLVFGVGRPLLEWPEAVEWGVAAAFVLLSCAVPGLYGNALLHADTHKKIARALTATHTLNEACALLAR